MPARACASGVARVTSMPSNRMRPEVGRVSPARQLKNVDFPAPFGPISPTISPSSTARSAPATAQKLPNALATLCASSSMRTPPQMRRRATPQVIEAAGLEARDQHNDAAIQNEGQSRAAAAEPGIGCGLQRNQNERADERPKQRAGAAERGDDHHLHRDQNAEAGIRVDEAGLDRVERSRGR